MPVTPSQRIVPYLLYEDVVRALAWLSAVGFREHLRHTSETGIVDHAEARIGDWAVMLGHPGPDYESPYHHGRVSDVLVVYVDDVDAHFAHARDMGVAVLDEPEDRPYGDRSYRVQDPEGHHWEFSQQVRDVPPEAWGAVVR